MLVDNNVYKNVYTGNGSTTAFPISFPFLDNAHIQVLRSSDGVNEEVVPVSEYTITGAGIENGGTCTFNVAPPADITIAVMRNVPITQLYAYRELDNFPAESHEDALAKLTMIDQQQQEQLNRALKVPSVSSQTPEEFMTELFKVKDDSQTAQSAAEAAQSAAESYRDEACECASQANATLESAVTVINAQKQASIESVQQQEQTSVEVVQSEGETQVQRLEDIATTILISAASYNKTVSVKLTSAITNGETYTLPESLAYLVGRSQLLVSGNGVWFYNGFQYEEVGTDGTASAQITFLQDLAVDDVLTFTVLASTVKVFTSTNSGLINDTDGYLKINVDGQTVLINASGQVYVPTMVGSTADTDGNAGLVPPSSKGDQDKVLFASGSWGDLPETGGQLPLGHIFTWPFSTPPDGSIIVNGTTYSRELYSDLWTYLSSHTSWIKTDDEWQSIASQNNGYCPYFSSGDGSTTFRVPKFAPYQQLAISATNATTYHQAGLPSGKVVSSTSVNGQGIVLGPGSKLQAANSPYGVVASTGGFSSTAPVGLSIGNNTAATSKGSPSDFIVDFDNIAESTTVQPESHEWIVCIVAFGRVTNVGEVDVANVMSAVANVQAALPNKINTTVPHIVEQWEENGGSNMWYRKWSDGRIEQGSYAVAVAAQVTRVTLPVPYTKNYFGFICRSSYNYKQAMTNVVMGKPSLQEIDIYHGSGTSEAIMWYTCGY